jgi:transcriptional regulator with XRE-family HTH domain
MSKSEQEARAIPARAVRIGEQLRNAREKQGIGLRPMAAALGISVNTLRAHETGYCLLRADRIVTAAEFMGVEPGALLPQDRKEEEQTYE